MRSPLRPASPRRPIQKPGNRRRANPSWPLQPSQILRPGEDYFSGPFFFACQDLSPPACSSPRRGELLHQLVIEVHTVVEVLHADALVFSMLAIVVDIKKHAR